MLKDRIKRIMAGGMQVGSGNTNKLTVGTDGAITQVGTNTNTLAGTTTFSGTTTLSGSKTLSGATSVTGVATFSAQPALSGSGRSTRRIWMGVADWATPAASVAAATLNSRWQSLYFTPDASTSSLALTGQFEVPPDFDVTAGVTPRIWWSTGAKAASSQCAWVMSFQNVATGAGSAAASATAAIANNTSAVANTIARSALEAMCLNAFSAGQLVSMTLTLTAGASTTCGCPYFLGSELEYTANKI
jgi:hypothetical protein